MTVAGHGAECPAWLGSRVNIQEMVAAHFTAVIFGTSKVGFG